MKILKQFKLVQEYPGSPELGEVALELKATGGSTVGYILKSQIGSPDFKRLKPKDVENYPDYWKEMN